jgi:hypothetical protein
MLSNKMVSIIDKLEQEIRKNQIKKKFNLQVLSPTLGKANPHKNKQKKKDK